MLYGVHMMSHIEWVLCHRKVGMWWQSEAVMTQLHRVWCLIQWVWYHAWSGWDIIKTVVGVIEWMWYHQYCKWCHTYAECGINNTQCCVVIQSGYDVINIVDRMSHVYCEISYIRWLWYWKSGCDYTDTVYSEVRYKGCDVRNSGLDVINKVV